MPENVDFTFSNNTITIVNGCRTADVRQVCDIS